MGAKVSKYRSDVIDMDISFPDVPSLAQHQILMHAARENLSRLVALRNLSERW